jgi:hypothetical protein
MGESAGMSPGDATKSYTQIRLGRAIASLTIGVCWLTSVEAHPVTTVKANKNAALQLRDFIAGLLLLAHGGNDEDSKQMFLFLRGLETKILSRA